MSSGEDTGIAMLASIGNMLIARAPVLCRLVVDLLACRCESLVGKIRVFSNLVLGSAG